MFGLIFKNVAVILVYMIIGYILCLAKKATVEHTKSISGILLYALSPAMIINSFLQLEYSKENFICMVKYFFVTLIIQLLFFSILYALLHKKYDNAKYRIMTIGGVLGNVGFFGLPIISSIFPENPIVMCYSSINVMSMNLIVFTIGVFMITNDKNYISLKGAVLNPTTLSIIVALPLYFFNVKFSETAMNSIVLLAKMVTPVSMFLLGIRLSAANMKEVFTRGFVYAACFLKLIVFPVIAFLCVHWLPFLDDTLKTTVIVLAAAPSGAVIQSLAELHECEQEFSANVVLLTTILSVIVTPLVVNWLV